MHRGTDIVDDLHRLEREARLVYEQLVTLEHHMPDTLYGYMMGVFARFDLMSAYWKGTFEKQSQRMVSFMTEFLQADREANSVAVLTWRHKLMHTAAPRELRDPKGGEPYRWLLHWGDEQIPRDQHFQFQAGHHILNLTLFGLIDNARSAAQAYLSRLNASPELSANYDLIARELQSYEFRLL